ncbi:TetR/AcrR family transcriptional regulator [Allohahella marinimesophila]|uniref:TetR/AcrR family transcriptional regulator n=2 Tax=Allohahella marinimesophila TaxID=1054972 RepID=A0ABP7PUA8_9GAMM
MTTKERILLRSLELFNEKGERHITTNHVAADLSISPGNLYYHYRSKQAIIYEIFTHYERLVDHYLQLPDRALSVQDEFDYLDSVFDGLWSYRFLHRDLYHYLDADPRLKTEYGQFTGRCLDRLEEIISCLEHSGILTFDPRPGAAHTTSAATLKRTLALNVWLVVTNWMSFLVSSIEVEGGTLSIRHMKSGIHQALAIQEPYVTEAYAEEVARLAADYPNYSSVGAGTSKMVSRKAQASF